MTILPRPVTVFADAGAVVGREPVPVMPNSSRQIRANQAGSRRSVASDQTSVFRSQARRWRVMHRHRVFGHEGLPRAVTEMHHRDNAVGLVNRVDNSVAVPPASIKQVAEIATFRGRCASARVFVEA
jgi:hypothetical protein